MKIGNKLLTRAEWLLNLGRVSEAIVKYEKYLTNVNPENIRILLKLGELYRAEENSLKAIKYYLSAVRLLRKNRDYPKAIESANLILSFDPENVATYHELLTIYRDMKLPDEAEAVQSKLDYLLKQAESIQNVNDWKKEKEDRERAFETVSAAIAKSEQGDLSAKEFLKVLNRKTYLAIGMLEPKRRNVS